MSLRRKVIKISLDIFKGFAKVSLLHIKNKTNLDGAWCVWLFIVGDRHVGMPTFQTIILMVLD